LTNIIFSKDLRAFFSNPFRPRFAGIDHGFEADSQSSKGANIVKILKSPSLPVMVLVASMTTLLSIPSSADNTQSSAAAVAEMKDMLGGVPTELQLYPESARAAGWAMMKSTDLNKATALPSKVRELIGLAVAAQIPCRYCAYYHATAAKAAGASQEEIREAVHQASLVRHWSAILYGNSYDFDTYKSEVDAAFK
jgi:AhpD family alkylhydroperoxidase